jgi:hypothetical protein
MGAFASLNELTIVCENMVLLCFVPRKWVLLYLAMRYRKAPKPAHVVFCMVDHFEPGTGRVSYEVEKKRM